jgi:nucleoside-diphosphate-sugar epimerase
LSERRPNLARATKIEGTRNIINAAESQNELPKFVFAGSVSTFGPTMHLQPPRTAEDPLTATDTYTETKIACEGIVRACRLPWTILRITAAPPAVVSTDMSALMFEMPLDQRIEFIHSRDVGLACANAVEAETSRKTLLIGGGKPNQMIQREFVSRVMKLIGLELPPESAFRVPKSPEEYYYTDWLDTEESQRLLKYQTRTFDQYLEEMGSALGVRRYFTRLFKGQTMKRLLAASPYYAKVDD